MLRLILGDIEGLSLGDRLGEIEFGGLSDGEIDGLLLGLMLRLMLGLRLLLRLGEYEFGGLIDGEIDELILTSVPTSGPGITAILNFTCQYVLE